MWLRSRGEVMIIQIGKMEWHDLKRQITKANTQKGECPHKRIQYIEHGEMLLCRDCGKQVSAVWALKAYFTEYVIWRESFNAEVEAFRKEQERAVIHRAALAVQDAWRKKNLTPTCPHCHKGIEPPDGFGKTGAVNRNYYETLPMEMKPNLQLTEKL